MTFSGGPDRTARPHPVVRQLFDESIPVIPIRPLTLTDIIVGSARAIVRHAKVSVGFTAGMLVAAVALFSLVFYVLLQVTLSVAEGDSENSLNALMIGVVGALIGFVVFLFVLGIPLDAAINGVVTVAADQAIRGAPVVFAQVYARMRQRFWPMCRLMFTFYLLLVLPGLVLPPLALFAGGWPALLLTLPVVMVGEFALGILYSFAPIVLVLEDRSVGESLKRSAALVKPAFWRVLGLHSAWLAMITVILMVSYCPFGLLLGVLGDTTFAFPLYLVAYLSIALPLFRTAQALVYTDLLIRQGTYGQELIRDRTANAASMFEPRHAETVTTAPLFELTPVHAARAAAGVALLLALVDLPGIAWFIIAVGAMVGEWHLRTKSVSWSAQVHEVLVALRLAAPDNRASSTTVAPETSSPPPRPTVSLTKRPNTDHIDNATPTTQFHVAEPGFEPLPASAFTRDVATPQANTPVDPTTSRSSADPLPYTPGSLAPTTGTGQRVPRNPRAWLALGCVTVLVVAGAITWSLTSGSSAPEYPPLGSEAQLRHTFPQTPSAAWTLDAERVFHDARFAAPIPSPTGSAKPGFLDLGDTLVTTVYKPRTDREPELVAVDAATGEIRWSAPVGFKASCASATIDGLLPCAGSTGMGPDYSEGVSFFRMSDGSIDHRLPATKISRVAVVGDDIITAGYGRISRGTPGNLTAAWSVDWAATDSCPGSGDAQYFEATAEFVSFGTDAGSMVVRAKDGRRVISGSAIDIAIYPGHGLVAVTCPGGSPTRRSTVVLDHDGNTLRTHDGEGGYAAPLVVPDSPSRYLVDGTAYDFADGKKVWSAGAGVADIIDDTVVLLRAETVSGIDFRTGETRWTRPFEVDRSFTVPFQWLSDRRQAMFAKDGALQAIDLRTGATTWTIPGVDDNPRRAGNGFATVDADRITFYGPTGGAATDARPEPTTTDRTELVTRCGKPPQLTPVHYRTEPAGLVVRMELRAACTSGDIISTDALRVSITQTGHTVATGAFDFSRGPLYLPPTGSGTTVTHDFTFGFGTFWRLPNSLGVSTDPGARQTGNVTNQLVECSDTGTSRGPDQGRFATAPITGSVAAATASVADQERYATDALRAQADADRPTVHRDLADRWLPQLSSKQLGLTAADTDGRVITWSATAILVQHLRLRVAYPEVRLVWSDEWRTFDLHGWWVTIAGATFTDPTPANAWCDARAIAPDQCFAKLVSNTRDSRGTTRYR